MRDLGDRWLDMFFFLYELGIDYDTIAVSYTHLTLPTNIIRC